MPTIPELAPAEANFLAATTEHEHLRDEIARLEMLLRVHRYNYETQMEEARVALEAAKAKQAASLTAWVSHSKGQYNRYILRAQGATDPTWDNRAWLRQMFQEHEKAWVWTLDAHIPGDARRKQFFLRDHIDVEGAVDYELQNAADTLLEGLGWNLTDLQNDGG